MTRRAASPALAAAAIVLAGAWVYAPALAGGWISDDTLEITGNRDLRTWAGLGRIWTGGDSPDYFPLKSTVQWAQWHLWGPHPFGYHCVTLAFHLISALLLWRLLRRLGIRLAWFGGLLFAVHPLFVESVAWISELKNTLSLPPLLLALNAYWDYEDGGGRKRYAASLGWFLASMLCKTSVAMFPAVLLLQAWWRRGRIGRRDCLAALPFAAVSAALGLVTLSFQQHRAIEGIALVAGGWPARVAAAGLAAAFYAWKTALPIHLGFVYPLWRIDPPALWQFAPWFAIVAALVWIGWSARGALGPPGWKRHVGFGVGWFLLNLVPVAGFFPMAYQRFSWVADHFAYVPSIGLIALATAGAGTLASRRRLRTATAVALAGIVAVLAVAARSYAGDFTSETALWARALRVNPAAALAYNNLGIATAAAGRRPEAIRDFQTAVNLAPDYPEAHNNLGSALLKDGRIEEAIPQFLEALRLDPEYALPRNNLGGALQAEGRYEEAAAAYRSALTLDPGYAEADYNLGVCLSALGRIPEAIACYRTALQIDPGLFQAENNLGFALARSGRLADAMIHYRRALQLHPEYPDAQDNLGVALAESGRIAEAVRHFQEALWLDPGYGAARHNLDIALRALENAGETR